MKYTRVEHAYVEATTGIPSVSWVVSVVSPEGDRTPLSAWEYESHAMFIAQTLDKQLVELQKAMQFPWSQIADALHQELSRVFTTSPVVSSLGFTEDESTGSGDPTGPAPTESGGQGKLAYHDSFGNAGDTTISRE